MKQARTLNILSLIFNALVLIVFIYVGIISNETQLTSQVQYIEVSAAVFYSIVAMICIVFNIISLVKGKRLPALIYAFKLFATVAVSMSLVFFFGISAYQVGFDYAALFNGLSYDNPTLFLSIVIPVLGIIGFVFFDHTEEIKFPVNFLSMVPVAIYGLGYIANNNMHIVEIGGTYDWYGFESIMENGLIIIWLALIVLALVLSIFFYLLNRGLNKAFFKAKPALHHYDGPNDNDDDDNHDNDGDDTPMRSNNVFAEPVNDEPLKEQELDEGNKNDSQYNAAIEEVEEKEIEDASEEPAPEGEKDEPVFEEEPVEPQPVKKTTKKPSTTKKVAKKPASTKKEIKDTAPANNGTKVYHLTKRKEDGMWAITFVGGKKPVKLFKTKKEAEEYLAVLTKNQGATALIRNSKGSKAGKFASSIKSDEDKK